MTTKVKSNVLFGPFGSGGHIEGFTADGWQGVRKAFESNFAENLELGSQLCIYHKGEKVVDLFGASPATLASGYSAESLQCVFSSGKTLESIALAMLVDRGLIAYEDLVVKHWPEFGQGGKGGITVADVLRHKGGVPGIVDPKNPAKFKILTAAEVRAVSPMEKMVEEAPRFPADGSRFYHAFFRGWILSGLVRRVDPAGRSIGNFIREEISRPLGLHYYCGMTEDEQAKHHMVDMTLPSNGYFLGCDILPAALGIGGHPELWEFMKYVAQSKDSPMRRQAVEWSGMPIKPTFNNSREGRALEIPSAGMMANARSIAKVNVAMAGDGTVEGIRILSAEGVARCMDKTVAEPDSSLGGWAVGLTQGGVGVWEVPEKAPSAKFFHPEDFPTLAGLRGWGGWGGSQSAWDPKRELALAYAMNGMSHQLVLNSRTRRILQAVNQVLPRV